MAVTVSDGTELDHDDIRHLVVDAGLPLDGLFAQEPTEVLVARDEDTIVGAAALEHYGGDGLLRSVVVRPGYRRGGVGSALTAAAIHKARASSLARVYLLTDAAERFFAGHGFSVIGRADAPPAVAASVEWAEACSDTAVPMVKPLA